MEYQLWGLIAVAEVVFIYLRSIIFEMLHLGERLKLQIPRGFQDTPFFLLFMLAKVHPHLLIIFSQSEASIA